MQKLKSFLEYHSILGVLPGASSAEIRRTYIRLVKQWHPDRFTHDRRSQLIAEEKLKEINEAYAVLRTVTPEPSSNQTWPAGSYGRPASSRSTSNTSSRSQYQYGSTRSGFTGSTANRQQTASSGARSYQHYRASAGREQYAYPPPKQSEKRKQAWALYWLVVLISSLTNMSSYLPQTPLQQPSAQSVPINVTPQVSYAGLQEQAGKRKLSKPLIIDQLRQMPKPPAVPIEIDLSASQPSTIPLGRRVAVPAEVPAPAQSVAEKTRPTTTTASGRVFPVPKTESPGFTPRSGK